MKRLLLVLFPFLIVASSSAFLTSRQFTPISRHSTSETQLQAIWDTIGSMYTHWGKKATASHILFKPSQFPESEARLKLLEIKEQIGDDPEKFAAAAKEWSGCPSSKNGGSLGEFGPGMMVKNFDDICFNEVVGVVHGPVSTQFGEHLILISKRSG